jgi:hypothetical protein
METSVRQPPGLTTPQEEHTMAFDFLNLNKIQASAVDQDATAVGIGEVDGDITAANSNRTDQSA